MGIMTGVSIEDGIVIMDLNASASAVYGAATIANPAIAPIVAPIVPTHAYSTMSLFV